jgi:hypothetical protein
MDVGQMDPQPTKRGCGDGVQSEIGTGLLPIAGKADYNFHSHIGTRAQRFP